MDLKLYPKIDLTPDEIRSVMVTASDECTKRWRCNGQSSQEYYDFCRIFAKMGSNLDGIAEPFTETEVEILKQEYAERKSYYPAWIRRRSITADKATQELNNLMIMIKIAEERRELKK
jgi:hypothetical protein